MKTKSLFICFFGTVTFFSSGENACSSKQDSCHLEELDDEKLFLSGHMRPFCSHRPPDRTIEELPFMISPEDFHANYISKHKPVVFKGAAKYWKAYSKWSDDLLNNEYGHLTFKLETKDDNKEKVPLIKTLKEFLQIYNESDLYLVDEIHPNMRKDVGIPHCLRCEEIYSKFFVSYLWMSSGKTSSSIHVDTDENLLCVIFGTKRVTLVSPIYSNDLYADDAPIMGISPVPANVVNLTKFPRVANIHYSVANLDEGDMLYIPQMWWHQVNSGGGRQMAVSLWWKSKPWWKHKRGSVELAKKVSSATKDGEHKFQYSFGDVLAEYEMWVQNVSDHTPRLVCKSQQKTMADYQFESDKYEQVQNVGTEDDKDEHIDAGCEFDHNNAMNPCLHCNHLENEEDCMKIILDYCNVYEDRGCVTILPQIMNRITQIQLQKINTN